MTYRQRIYLFVVWLFAGFGISFSQVIHASQQVIATDQHLCIAGKTLSCHDWPNLKQSWENRDLREPGGLAIQQSIIIAVSGSKLFAFDLESGEQRWSFSGSQRLFDPVIHRGIVYGTAKDGQITAIDLEAGNLVWQRQLDQAWIYPPAIVGKYLITGGQGADLWGLEATTGNTIWQHSFSQEIVYRPVPDDDGSVYVSTFDAFLHKIDADNGKLIWSRKMPAAQHQLVNVGSDLLLSGGMDGAVQLINTNNGSTNWSRWIDSAARFSLYTSSSIVVVLSADGRLITISMANGQVLNTKYLAPADGNRIFITTDSILIFGDDDAVRRIPIPDSFQSSNNVAEATPINRGKEEKTI